MKTSIIDETILVENHEYVVLIARTGNWHTASYCRGQYRGLKFNSIYGCWEVHEVVHALHVPKTISDLIEIYTVIRSVAKAETVTLAACEGVVLHEGITDLAKQIMTKTDFVEDDCPCVTIRKAGE